MYSSLIFSLLFLYLHLSDGPCAESCHQPHLWSSSGKDQTTRHLLQRLPDPLQLWGTGTWIKNNHTQNYSHLLDVVSMDINLLEGSVFLCVYPKAEWEAENVVHVFLFVSSGFFFFLRLHWNLYQGSSKCCWVSCDNFQLDGKHEHL